MKSILALCLLLSLAGTAIAQEDKCITILKSDASTREKADACRELARVGTRQAVPVLASLLVDTNLSHLARYALEPIPDPSVDAALREALGTVRGRPLAGIIASMGVRKDPQAIAPLARLLSNADLVVAQAAARALGSIGPAALPTLETALDAPATRLAVCEGLLRCADGMSGAAAAAVYDRVEQLPSLPRQVRLAAWRGAIRSRGTAGEPRLAEAIRTESPVSAADAIRVAMEIPGPAVTQLLASELPQAQPEKQILLLQALGNRGDVTAVHALLPIAQSGSAQPRVAALRSLVQLGDPVSIPALVAAAKDSEKVVSTAGETALSAFPGREADAAVLGLLNESSASLRVAAVEAATQRGLAAAVPCLLKMADNSDGVVAEASFRALGELAGGLEIPAMVDLLLSTRHVAAGEAALSAVCARQSDPAAGTNPLLPGLARARGESKLALLRLLGTIGSSPALTAVRAAAAGPDEAVQQTALRTLCDWPNAEALPDLARIARTPLDPKLKILVQRGQLRLISMDTVPAELKLAQLKELLPFSERAEEKRIALAVLGGIPSVDSLVLVTPYLENEELKEEASASAVAISEKIVSSHPAEVVNAMQRVHSSNAQLTARARQILARAAKH